MSKLFNFLIMTVILAACNRITAPGTSVYNTEMMHHKWAVTEMHGATAPLPDIFLDLRDISATNASAGCDSVVFTPKYEKHGRVNFENISVPLTMCKGSTLIDRQFLQNLRRVHYYQVSEKQLSLFDAGRIKIFHAVYHPGDEKGSLLRRWQIVEMMNGNAALLAKDNAFIEFAEGAKAAANLGCNHWMFSVTTRGTHGIRFGNAAATKKMCTDAVNDEVFEKIIPLVSMYRVVGNTLELFDKDNALLIKATAALQ